VANGTLVIASPLANIMLERLILDPLEDTYSSGDGPFLFGSFALSKILPDISEASILFSMIDRTKWAPLPYELKKTVNHCLLSCLEFSLNSYGSQWLFQFTFRPFPWTIPTSGWSLVDAAEGRRRLRPGPRYCFGR
jgi:hypothetical protein